MHGVEGPSTDKPTDNIFAQHRLCRDLGISHWEWLVNLEELLDKKEFQFFGVPATQRITMLTATKTTKADPIVAAIKADRLATAARYPILEAMMAMGDDAPERGSIEDAHDKAIQVEIEAQAALTNIPKTTIPGLMAVTVYVSKLTNRGHDWTIGGDLIDEDAGIPSRDPSRPA